MQFTQVTSSAGSPGHAIEDDHQFEDNLTHGSSSMAVDLGTGDDTWLNDNSGALPDGISDVSHDLDALLDGGGDTTFSGNMVGELGGVEPALENELLGTISPL